MATVDRSLPSRLLRPFAGEAISPPPIWLMRQAGRYLPEYRALRAKAGSFLQLCYNPTLAAEAALQPVRRYGLDVAINPGERRRRVPTNCEQAGEGEGSSLGGRRLGTNREISERPRAPG